ncbi:MAG TPA: transporter substrate-binding domain-containing protein [Opitutus sp.]|nr:transporter substrate-binding domain-containing protein [Opitutus sp.]
MFAPLTLPAQDAGGGLAAAFESERSRAPLRRVGVLSDNFPLSFRHEHGAVDGFVYELTREIEKVMGLQFERVEGPTDEINRAFREGRLDLLQSYAHFPEREDHADFSVPYLVLSGAIFVREGGPSIGSVADLRGRRVLVHRGSLGETVLRRAGLEQSIVYVASLEKAVQALEAGEGDATLLTRLTGLAMVHELGLKRVRVLDVPVEGYEVRYCYAVRDGDRELLAKINEGLAVLVRVGTFDRVYRRWFGHVEPRKFTVEEFTLAVAAGLAIALVVSLWAVVRLQRLRRRIARQAETLRLSDERHRAVFDGARDGLMVVTRDAHGNWGIEQINPPARRMLALAGEQGGMLLAEACAREPALAARLEEAGARRDAVEFEHELAGDRGCWRIGVSPLGEGVLVRISDITAAFRQRHRAKQQEAQIIQAQKLEALGTLAGGVAHDFNNLLSVIMGNTDLVLLGLPPDGPEANQLRRVLAAARRARQLVRQVLTFSRRTEASREVLAVGPVIEEMIEFLRALAHGAVEFEQRTPADLPDIVADTAQLHQVLMNIGTNAVQAMRGRRGRLTVTTELVTVDDEVQAQLPQLATGRFVRIGIQDTGPGIPPEVVARIFEPYFTTKPPGEGTGLGLSVVHGIMQLHGGAVTVYSQVGRGTLFSLYFPAASGPAQEDDPEVPRGAGERVLLVDDEPAVARTAQQILAKLGYDVSVHSAPADALEALRGDPAGFAVVLTDLAMPHMNGLQFVAALRQIARGLPVVAMSGFFSPAEEEALDLAGVAVRLHKPLTYVSVARAMAAALRPGVAG